MLAIADRGGRTLTDAEEKDFHAHLEGCDDCRALADEAIAESGHWRWIARLPEDAFEDSNALVLPTVDPIVFDIDMEIAAGGMGRITKAMDRRLGREVALKEVLEPNMRARFEREALITARLQHPAIVPIYEAGTFPNGSAFYTMRLVWGGTLGSAIHKTNTMAERLALLPHVLAVIDALAYAHSNNIIHRDLKPGNVLVGEFGETVVIDWGLAKELGTSVDSLRPVDADTPSVASRVSNPSLTRVGSVLGTPGFMSPEQASGGNIDERADVYALGAILYNLLAGLPPYFDKHSEAGSTKIIAIGLAQPPTPIGELAPDAPADLQMIVEKAMARSKDDRYRSAKEMAEELRRFAAGKLITREYTTRELLARWIKKHRTPVAIGSIAATALAITAVFSIINITRSRNAAEAAETDAVRAQGEAEDKARLAEARTAELREQQGLQRLRDGDSRGAVTELRASLISPARLTTAVRYLIAAASHDRELQQVTMAAPGRAIAFDDDHHAVTIEDGFVRTWSSSGSQLREARLGGGHIEDAWFAPDAKVVGFRRGSSVEVWEVEHGEQRYAEALEAGRVAFDQHSAPPCGAARPGGAGPCDRTGQRAAVFAGTRLQLLDLGSIDAEHHFTRRDGWIARSGITDLALHGDRVAACEADGTLEIWDAAKPAAHQAISDVRCTTLAFLGSDQLVLATRSFALLRWPIGATRPDATMSGHIAINAIAVNDKRKLIATGDATGIVMWGWGGEARGESRDVQGGITRVLFTREGDAMIGAGADDRVFVWDTASFHLRQAMPNGAGSIDGIAVDTGGDHIAAAGSAESHAWAVPAGRLTQRAGASDEAQRRDGLEIERATIAGDLWIAVTKSRVMRIRRLATKLAAKPGDDLVRDVPLPFSPSELRASADGRFLILYSAIGEIAWLDPTTDPQVGTRVPLLGTAKLTSDPRSLLTLEPARALITEAGTGAPIGEIRLDVEGSTAGDISPDGTRLVTVGPTTLTEWEIATGRAKRLDVQLPEGHHYTPRFDPTGTRVVLFGGHEAAVIYDAAGKHELAPARSVDAIEFSRDGKAVAFGIGNTVQFWRTAADTDDQRAKLFKEPMFTVTSTIPKAFALADNGLYATGSVDGTIRIWDASGRNLDRLIGSQMGISHLEFGLDETRLLGYSDDKVASLWDVHLESGAFDDVVARMSTAR